MPRRVFKGQHTGAGNTEILRDGAIAVDLSTNDLYLHDGATAGGQKLIVGKSSDSSFQQAGGVPVTFDTYQTSAGKVAEYKVYVAGDDTSYPTIGTASEINFFTITILHDGTNLTLVKSSVSNTGSTFITDFTATISGTTISVKAQSNVTYNTVRFVKTIF